MTRLATPEAAFELAWQINERERKAQESERQAKDKEFNEWYEEELRKEEEAVSGGAKSRFEQMREQYPEEAAQAEAESKAISSSELAGIKERRDRAIEMLERRSEAVRKTGGNHKSVCEYEVAFAQAERLDSEYAVAWFNYA